MAKDFCGKNGCYDKVECAKKLILLVLLFWLIVSPVSAQDCNWQFVETLGSLSYYVDVNNYEIAGDNATIWVYAESDFSKTSYVMKAHYELSKQRARAEQLTGFPKGQSKPIEFESNPGEWQPLSGDENAEHLLKYILTYDANKNR